MIKFKNLSDYVIQNYRSAKGHADFSKKNGFCATCRENIYI